MRWQDNRAAGLPFRQPGVKGTQELTMIDFARKKAGPQAVRLNLFEVLVRKLCYLLAQKGNPELKA